MKDYLLDEIALYVRYYNWSVVILGSNKLVIKIIEKAQEFFIIMGNIDNAFWMN